MSKMLRNTPTSTSVRLAADPHAAKQAMSRMNGTVNPAKTSRAFLGSGSACAADIDAILTTPLGVPASTMRPHAEPYTRTRGFRRP